LSCSNPSSPANFLGSHIKFISGLLKGVTVADTLKGRGTRYLVQKVKHSGGVVDSTAFGK
jgi:hypothetical protein